MAALPVLRREKSWNLLDGLPDSCIKSIVRTRTGDLWFGTRESLVRFRGETMSLYNITNAPALRNSEVARMVEDSKGGLWLGTPSGVVHWHDERFERLDPTGVPDFSVNAILPESRSGLWIGGGYMLARCHQGVWTRYTRESGMRDADVNSLAEHPDGRVWVGCHRGLLVFDPDLGQFLPIEMPGPFENYHVQAITFAPDGAAWLLTHCRGEPHCRLWRVEGGRWEDHTGKDTRIGDRLLIAAFAQPGAFWEVSAHWGLERWIDPTSQELIPPPPAFRAPAWSFCDDGLGNLWVGTLSSGLELWRSADATASIPFATVGRRNAPPPNHIPLLWTLAITALGLAIGAGAFHRSRVARLRQDASRGVTEERQRIASHLHDHLGSHLTELSLLAERVGSEQTRDPSSGSPREAFSRSARELSQALRETLWEANPADATLEGLLNHLGDQAHAFLQAAGIRCRLAFPEEYLEVPLAPQVRQEVFLATREALHNVVRHAGASEVRLVATVADDRLEIQIKDNGTGFAMRPSRDDSNGHGLPGMHRRLRSLGGSCRVTSHPGNGTNVVLALPLTRASQN